MNDKAFRSQSGKYASFIKKSKFMISHLLIRINKASIALAVSALTFLFASQTGNSRELSERAKAMEDLKIAEPAVIGKVIDRISRKPIEGAFVYGYYTAPVDPTPKGALSPSYVKPFEAITDREGVFRLESWNTSEATLSNRQAGTMPLMIWKPGYVPEQTGFSQIDAQVAPRGRKNNAAQISASNTLDIRAEPIELMTDNRDRSGKIITDQRSLETGRYFALGSHIVENLYLGDQCSWEAYKRVLLAQHVEWKKMLRESFPPHALDSEGYGLGTYIHPTKALNVAQSFRSVIDTLKTKRKEAGANWKCADPQSILEAKK